MDELALAFRDVLAPMTPSDETIAHFSSTPWAVSYFTDPEYRPIRNFSRTPRPAPSTEQTFFARTLNTPTTMQAWQIFYRPSISPSTRPDEILTLVKLGTDLNGFSDNSAQGGFVAALLDEVIGLACQAQVRSKVFTLTATLKVNYKRPVKTPGVVLVRSWVHKEEGKKQWGRGTVEDGMGNVLSEGEALYIKTKPRL